MPEGGRSQPHAIRLWAVVGVSVRTHSSVPAETAAVVLRVHYARRGPPGRLWYGAVGRSSSRRNSDAAFAVLRSVSLYLSSGLRNNQGKPVMSLVISIIIILFSIV